MSDAEVDHLNNARKREHEDQQGNERNSKRLRVAESEESVLTVPEPNHSEKENEASSQLCEHCRGIDFDEIFQLDIKEATSSRHSIILRNLHDLSSTPSCAFCQMLVQVRDKSSYYQRRHHPTRDKLCITAFSAARRFSRDIPIDTTIFSVQPIDDKERTIRSTDAVILPVLPKSSNAPSGRRVLDTVDWSVVKNWLQLCSNNHSKYCESKESIKISGLRVIDCNDMEVIRIVKIAETESVDYVTLSYLWGKSTLEDPVKDCGLQERLPRTIGDAAHVVRSLGFRYLWVDRYCIPQGSETEKHSLIENMGNIYANSVLTLIAAAGDHPDHGLPGVGSVSRLPQSSARIGSHTFVTVAFDVDGFVAQSKWNTRGWTYQEALLSKRKLVFTDRIVYFQCGAMHCMEDLSLPILSLHSKDLQQMKSYVNIPKVFPSRGVGIWPAEIFTRIQEYYQRDLTYDSDSFKAFQGIFKSFERMKPSIFNLYGLPIMPSACFYPPLESATERLLFALAWSLPSKPSRRQGIPSWTWAGWKRGNKDNFPPFSLLSGPVNHKQVCCMRCECTFPPTTVLVEFTDGKVRPWSKVHQKIILHSHLDLPKYLLIRGFVVEVELVVMKESIEFRDPRGGRNKWTSHTSLPIVEYERLAGRDLKFVALIMSMDQEYAIVLWLVSIDRGMTYERLKRGGLNFAWAWPKKKPPKTLEDLQARGVEASQQWVRIG